MAAVVLLVLLLMGVEVASQNDSAANQFVQLDHLPKELDSGMQAGNHKMVVRTDFKVWQTNISSY